MSRKNAAKLRLIRRHKRNKPATIMLTSMIDIFTVLVFFLIVNSQYQVHLPNNQSMHLPKSVAQDFPKEKLSVMVTPQDIYVDDRKIASIQQVLASPEPNIPALAQELQYRSGRMPPERDEQGQMSREIYILGDRRMPYALLRKIMVTCSMTDFSRISFAVERQKGGSA